MSLLAFFGINPLSPFLLKLQKFQHTCCVHLRKNPYLAAFPKPAVPSLDV